MSDDRTVAASIGYEMRIVSGPLKFATGGQLYSLDARDYTDDARVLDLLESAALEAWSRRPSAADEWFSSHGETTVRIPHQTIRELAAEWLRAQAVAS